MMVYQGKVLSIKAAANLLGVHQSTVRRWFLAGNFVSRVRLSPRRFGFFEADILEWAEGRRELPA